MIEGSTNMGERKHILTIVLEDYFQVGAFRNLIPTDHWERFETRLKSNLYTTLELLAETNNTATFFACGWIADNHPDLLIDIIGAGHEVACQGYFHYDINEVSENVFAQDLRRSRYAMEDALGTAIYGFRLGRGWIGEKELWILDQLIEQGFSYDSSICRLGREFSNQPSRTVIHQHSGIKGSLFEIPISSQQLLYWSLPISGGNYFRQLPHGLLKWGVERWLLEHEEPLVLYFHTWELDTGQPIIAAANILQRLRHYRNLDSMSDKIKYYLTTHQFSSVAEYLELDIMQQPAPQLTRRIESVSVQEHLGRLTASQPLTLLIPCYNEEATLPYLKKTLDRFAIKSKSVFNLQYIFIDDGSRDNTWVELNQLFSEQENCKFLRHENNQGIAAAILTGIQHTTTDLLSVLDADCTFSPDQLLDMIELLREDVDVVVASPAHERGAMRNVPLWRTVLSRGSALMYRCVLRHKLTSYTSCFRLYRLKTVQDMKLYNHGFCGVTEILGRLDIAGYRIKEYPAILEVRLLGESKINLIKTTGDHLKLIFHLAAKRWFRKPMPEDPRIDPSHI
ncbi:glycosyltransferase [Sedimenticola selenatireducens]|uniref:Glycosyltransferase n=1 Tax=Sedimenticola selenatireducens TaxID=191960 RepID=A0A558DTA3_9GAMM|nr:glycosyltransferase [Sedimenticola selenatireducens]TVO76829.1 glycosyltransferase [Sedimenticola selenatireducens]TVT64272.1 MAG: glycosyltransferase [Sedimenticola selenatireducens]